MPTDHRLSGPDFLDSLAREACANGLQVNAGEYRQRATDWRRDQERIEQLEADVARLERQLRTADDQARVLHTLKTHLQAANDSLASATAIG